MAKSAEYKNVYPEDTNLPNPLSAVENVTEDLQSTVNDFAEMIS